MLCIPEDAPWTHINFLFNDHPITFNVDGVVLVNATEMGKYFGKQPKDWLRTAQAQEFISVYSNRRKCLITDLVQVKAGSPELGGGTWMHEDIALEYARWLNPYFARFSVPYPLGILMQLQFIYTFRL
jgi:peptidoglycan hydrolase-like protein with peptidoglycan-binding domain